LEAGGEEEKRELIGDAPSDLGNLRENDPV